jgi:NADPH:quinone reductase-like Zn-dependent oxidoreductase
VVEEIPETGAGQILVRVRASSVNFRDPVIARRDRQSGGADGRPMSITVVSISDVFSGGPDG